MRILSSFSDFYDEAAAARSEPVTYYRSAPLFPGPDGRPFDSKLTLPDEAGIISRRHSLKLDYLLIAGECWPIAKNRKGSRPISLKAYPNMKEWEAFALQPFKSAEGSALQKAIGAPVARIGPYTPGKIWVYPTAPRLADYGLEETELPERVALWIESWLRHSPQEKPPELIPKHPARRIR